MAHIPSKTPVTEVLAQKSLFCERSEGSNLGFFPLEKKYDVFNEKIIGKYEYGSIPIDSIFSGMNTHLPAILMFTRGTRVLTHPHMSPRILTVISVRSK